MSEEINLDDLHPIEISVRYGGQRYLLREASEGAVCRWRSALLSAAKPDDNGKPTSFDIAETEPLLVSLCLFHVDPDGRRNVSLATIQDWPARVVRILHDKIMDISELREVKGTEETTAREADRKNSQPAAAGISSWGKS